MLRTKMQWHQERQRLLSENISNSDTPNFKPSDLTPPKFDSAMVGPSVSVLRTSSGHLGGFGGGDSTVFQRGKPGGAETRPAGNAVSLEDEMLKVAENQMDYQAAASLYTKSLGLMKTALGKR
jgi:flagellar basal-body rod protein FlgB